MKLICYSRVIITGRIRHYKNEPTDFWKSISNMQVEEKILTWHPEGKRGVYMPRKYYDSVAEFILSVLKGREITITDLIALAEEEFRGMLTDVSWHILTVKLDLEARGVIKTIVKTAPFRFQLLKLRPRELKKYNTSLKTPVYRD